MGGGMWVAILFFDLLSCRFVRFRVPSSAVKGGRRHHIAKVTASLTSRAEPKTNGWKEEKKKKKRISFQFSFILLLVVGATTTHSCDAGRKFSFDFIVNERKSDGSYRSCDSRSNLTRSISLTQAICVPSPSVTSIHPPRQYNKKKK